MLKAGRWYDHPITQKSMFSDFFQTCIKMRFFVLNFFNAECLLLLYLEAKKMKQQAFG